MKLKLIAHKYITGTYFDNKLSMFSFAPSAMEEMDEGPQKDPLQELEGGVRSKCLAILMVIFIFTASINMLLAPSY